MLKLKNITKDYYVGEMTINALKGISLDFRQSEFVAVLGPSGCGKTTMLNIIGGLDRYTSGDLIIDGKSTKDFKDRDWDAYRNHCIGYVFQSYNLIPHLSVAQNVELALTISGESRAERKRRAEIALEKVGLSDQLNKKPNQLSGGQMQRVAIARALVNNPQIIMADEPTGALDSKTSVQIMDLLKEIAKDHLVIMVTHNNELANKYATRIIKLKDGEVTDDSHPVTPQELEQMQKQNQSRTAIWEQPKQLRIQQKAEKKSAKQSGAEKGQKVKIKRTSMSFFTALHLSFKNLWTKKGRTSMVSFAASIGIIGVALVLAISNGFKLYINKIETDTLSNFPITISRLGVDLDSLQNASWMETPKDVPKYPQDGTTIGFYESIDHFAAMFKTNTITKEYVEYLDGLKKVRSKSRTYKDQPVALDVQKSYSIHMPLITVYERSEGVVYVNKREQTSGMMSLFGGSNSNFTEVLDNPEFIAKQYDKIYGEYPVEYNEIALIVDETNRISKNLAKALGFNESLDQMDFDLIVGKTYKLILNDAFYVIEGESVRTIDTNDPEVLEQVFQRESGDGVIELKISGILRSSEEAVLQMYSPGLIHLPSLTQEYLKSCENAPIAQKQQEKLFDKEVSLGQLQIYKALFTQQELREDFLDVQDFYTTMVAGIKAVPGGEQIFLMPKEQQIGIFAQMFSQMEEYSSLSQQMLQEYATMFVYLGDSLEQLKDNESYTFGLPVYYFWDLLKNGFSPASVSKEAIMQRLGIGGLPSAIYIYPRSFETKAEITAYLDAWNKNNKDNEIVYNDPAKMLSSTMGQMIDIISYVLIAFAAVSLIVSSIMIGIITYVSVIERTKEIGVLRSIGARKKDIGNVFNAETVIIGFSAGIIGVILAYILCFPINKIIRSLSSGAVIGNIAILHPLHAIVLVGISVLLTLISGLIPSSIASNRDPVVALRTE